ncbi:glutamine amidotransferase class-I [Klebsiella pneumoniae]|nr:glutamine amidotransferase class-I [Klebsiella pneumoniae]SYO06472.1 glutamine amidotransferase class-I [Klebsiella pneumoniae]
MRVHFIVHESFEAPGAYETWAINQGHDVTYSRVYAGDRLPDDAVGIDFLIVMGGPQDPDTTLEECPHFNAKAEQALIASAVKTGKAVIGICLGSQLIGEALGAPFSHSPEKEIGKFPITLSEDGRKDEMFSHFGKTLEVGHWHNDMPGLTPEAKIIAYSEGCPRQIVAYSDRVFGFQCHMELTLDVVERLIAHSEKDLSRAAEYRFVDTPEALRAHDYSEMNQVLFGFLAFWLFGFLAFWISWKHVTQQRKHNVMLGKLAIGFDFNVRSWHRADKLSDLKVRYEREAEKCSGRLYTDLGIRACSIRDQPVDGGGSQGER